MPKKNKSSKPKLSYPIGKQTGKQEAQKEPDFYLKHKSTIWTILVLVLLAIFFIINNTRKIPDEGPYPPNYNQKKSTIETFK